MATGIKNIDTLVKNFIKAEENNFALFRFVNDLSNEIELLEQQIQDMKDELRKFQEKGLTGDNSKLNELKILEEKLSKTELTAEKYELDYQSALKKVNSMKGIIKSIFILLECNKGEEHIDLLGSQGVTESNMMIYLGIIEQRVTELLYAYALTQQEKAKREKGSLEQDDAYVEAIDNPMFLMQVGPSTDVMYGPTRIEIPSNGEDNDDDAMSDVTNEKPLGIEEFKQRVENTRKQELQDAKNAMIGSKKRKKF